MINRYNWLVQFNFLPLRIPTPQVIPTGASSLLQKAINAGHFATK